MTGRRIPLVSLALIAAAAHEVNRSYCASLGDLSQPAWPDAPEWQQKSALLGVHLHLSGEHGPEASHEAWSAQKFEDGWKYGPVKNPELKEHPCLVPFDQLPREQQAKDFLFRGAVHALSRPASEADDEIGSIETVDQFAGMLAGWHGNQVTKVKHMREIPVGSGLLIEVDGAEREIAMEGDVRLGYQAGIDTALAELGTLPFVGSVDDEPEQAANDAAPSGN